MGKVNRLIFGDHRDPREELAELFNTSVPESGSPPPEAVAWGREVLTRAGVNPSTDPLLANKALRDNCSDLGLKTSTYLVKQL